MAAVDSLVREEAGAPPLKPVATSSWGYGGVVRAPDGTIGKVATSSKGSHRLVVRGDAGAFSGPDGFPRDVSTRMGSR